MIKNLPLSFHFNFLMSITFFKYSNTFILCVIHIIYKKLTFLANPTDLLKRYYKNFLKVSYFVLKCIKFSNFQDITKNDANQVFYFLTFLRHRFFRKTLMQYFLQLLHTSIIISTQSMLFNCRYWSAPLENNTLYWSILELHYSEAATRSAL